MGLLSVLGVFDVPFFDQISLIPSRSYFPEIIPASTRKFWEVGGSASQNLCTQFSSKIYKNHRNNVISYQETKKRHHMNQWVGGHLVVFSHLLATKRGNVNSVEKPGFFDQGGGTQRMCLGMKNFSADRSPGPFEEIIFCKTDLGVFRFFLHLDRTWDFW